jgi:hypothetical protein
VFRSPRSRAPSEGARQGRVRRMRKWVWSREMSFSRAHGAKGGRRRSKADGPVAGMMTQRDREIGVFATKRSIRPEVLKTHHATGADVIALKRCRVYVMLRRTSQTFLRRDPVEEAMPSCPCLTRASTSYGRVDADGRVESGHDDRSCSRSILDNSASGGL